MKYAFTPDHAQLLMRFAIRVLPSALLCGLTVLVVLVLVEDPGLWAGLSR